MNFNFSSGTGSGRNHKKNEDGEEDYYKLLEVNRDASFEEIKKQYESNSIAPLDIKLGLSDYIDGLVKPIRDKFEEPEMKELYTSAYN